MRMHPPRQVVNSTYDRDGYLGAFARPGAPFSLSVLFSREQTVKNGTVSETLLPCSVTFNLENHTCARVWVCALLFWAGIQAADAKMEAAKEREAQLEKR